MKKLALCLTVVLAFFSLQAKWVEVPGGENFSKVSAVGNNLWVVNAVQKEEAGRKKTEYFLLKFDHAKNSWQKISFLPRLPRVLVALADGGALIFYSGQESEEMRTQLEKRRKEQVAAQRQLFEKLVDQGKISKDLLEVRDKFEKENPVGGWYRFMRSEDFKKIDEISRSRIERWFSKKFSEIEPIYEFIFTKFYADGRSTAYNIKTSFYFPQDVTSSPDGAVFLLPRIKETKESRAAYAAAVRAAQKSALERAKKDLEQAKEGSSELVTIMNGYKKALEEGKISKKAFDLINSLITHYNPFVGPDSSVHNEPTEDFFAIFDEVEKLEENDKKMVGFFIWAFASTVVDRYYSDKEAKKQRKYTQPLYRFFDGKLQRIADLGNSEYDFSRIAAVSKDELWLSRSKKLGRDKFNNSIYDIFVQKWDGTSFTRVGGKIPSGGLIAVGSDKSVYIAGSPIVENEYTQYLLKLVDGKWEPINLAFDKGTKGIDSLSVNSESDVWLLVEDEERNNFLYRWNGKSVKKIEGLEFRYRPLLYGKHGFIFVRAADKKLYRWVEEKK